MSEGGARRLAGCPAGGESQCKESRCRGWGMAEPAPQRRQAPKDLVPDRARVEQQPPCEPREALTAPTVCRMDPDGAGVQRRLGAAFHGRADLVRVALEV